MLSFNYLEMWVFIIVATMLALFVYYYRNKEDWKKKKLEEERKINFLNDPRQKWIKETIKRRKGNLRTAAKKKIDYPNIDTLDPEDEEYEDEEYEDEEYEDEEVDYSKEGEFDVDMEVEEEIESVGYGSGVLISQEGIIITSYHVVDGAKSIEIKFPGLKTIYSAEVVENNPHTDIAVLKINSYGKSVENGKSIPLTKNSKKLQSGLEVHTIGYPLGNIMGENPRLSSGRISSPFGIHDDPRHFQIDNPIQSGNSGGVVFDNLGNIMGIIVASINDELVYSVTGSISQNINFAIKFSYIQALLDITNYEIDYSSLSNEDIKLEDLVAKIEPFTCQITRKS